MQAVRRSARQQTQAHKSADKLETLRDMKASRERQAGYGSEEDAEARLSERQRAALRREIADLDSSGEEGGGADEGASEGEGARSGASDDEPEGGDEAPLEDIMAMQVRVAVGERAAPFIAWRWSAEEHCAWWGAGEAHGPGGLEAAAEPRRDAARRRGARGAAQQREP